MLPEMCSAPFDFRSFFCVCASLMSLAVQALRNKFLENNLVVSNKSCHKAKHLVSHLLFR